MTVQSHNIYICIEMTIKALTKWMKNSDFKTFDKYYNIYIYKYNFFKLRVGLKI